MGRLSLKRFADDVFDGRFFDVDVGDRQLIQQLFARGNDLVAGNFESDSRSLKFDHLAKAGKPFGFPIRRAVPLNGQQFVIGEAVDDFGKLSVKSNLSVVDKDHAFAQRLNVRHVMAG